VSSQQRFILAVALMLGVLVLGNLLVPPAPAPDAADPQGTSATPDSVLPPPAPADAGAGTQIAPDVVPTQPSLPTLSPQVALPAVPGAASAAETFVTVEGPLYRFSVSNLGARIRTAELLAFPSFTREGPVELVGPFGLGLLGNRIVVEADTIDLRTVPFQVAPGQRLQLQAGGGPETLAFTYQHPTQPFGFEVEYTFDPDSYLVEVRGRTRGLSRGLLLTDLGAGPAWNEVDQDRERANLAYVVNHLQTGVRSTSLVGIEARRVEEGPFLWAATKSSYFAVGILPRVQEGDQAYLGGVLAWPLPAPEERADVAVTQSLEAGGTFEYRFYAGPQDYAGLQALGNDFQEVNPVGWAWLRPVLRPIIGIIMWVLVFFHTNLAIGYGWVMILVGVLMRIVLFPLNHKALKAQLKNMTVQPLLKEIQTKYKDQPEKLQKELMKLYKEHGFNPFAGCWPMLLPWPLLIALFFVFQNTIELRGVPFAWLPDLSTADPFFILPILLGVSMFFLQWISMRTMEDVNPQMKVMLWGMPVFMVVLFAALPSGLNLYYLTTNIATLPQTWWVAHERKKVRAKGPPPTARS